MADVLTEQGKRDRRDAWRARIFPILGLVIFLAIWEILVIQLGIKSYLLPRPTEIVSVMYLRMGMLIEHSMVTFYEMLLGFFLAILVAVPLAILITASKTFDNFMTPIILFFQTVPKIAIAPLFLVWFGVGTLPKVLVAFLICFFPILIDTSVGLRSVPSEMINLARSMGASKISDLHQVPIAHQPALLLQRTEGGSHAGRGGRCGW